MTSSNETTWKVPEDVRHSPAGLLVLLDDTLSYRDRILWQLLADAATHSNPVTLNAVDLSELLGCSRRTIYNGLRSLRQRGLVEFKQLDKVCSNTYWLLDPGLLYDSSAAGMAASRAQLFRDSWKNDYYFHDGRDVYMSAGRAWTESLIAVKRGPMRDRR